MSYLDEYLKMLENEKQPKTGSANSFYRVVARPRFTSDYKPKKNESTWFSKGAFEDGYQFGDIIQTLLGTAGDVGVNVVKGGGRLVEGITDLASYGVAGVADLFGADDWADNVREKTEESWVDNLARPADEYLDRYSVLGEKFDSVAEGLGQIGVIIATGGIAGAAGLGSAGATALTTGTLFASGVGSGMGEARQLGAEGWDALKHGLNVGATDAVSELIFGGLGKGAKALGVGKGLSSLDDMLAKAASGKFKSQIAKNVIEWGIKSGAEGLEEVGAGLAQAYSKSNLTGEEFEKVLKDENLFEQFMVGAITSGIAQASGRHGVVQATKRGQDFITGLTQNEQAVAKKVYENELAEKEKSGKLSLKEKNALYENVVNRMEKGYIDTDTIESVLGGETYSQYQKLAEEESSLKKERETLAKVPADKRTDSEIARMNEIDSRLGEIDTKAAKENLFNTVNKLTANDANLRESYNERAKRGQAFETDLSKYDAKQQATIQKAVNSGILNNTRRTHEFVDMVAKISADTGVLFDFANNAKLKESGFAIDGKQVNGFVTKDGVTINVNSAKALNSVVGHEITHVLEGTELYNELQNVITEYAKSKGDYQERFDTLTALYKDIEGADIDAELVADLVGDYLFTDTDFVKRLSSEHQSVFRKIFDEIKYLCKVATAGSKEARELEKIKKVFEEAYRTETKNPTAAGGVKYKISDLDIDRVYIDFKDAQKANEAVDAKVSDLVERGKVVPLSDEGISKYKESTDWSIYKEVRQLLRDVLEPYRGISVVFEHGDQGAVAYLTSKGIDHSVGGPASPKKAAAFEKFSLLVKNAEYVYSSNNNEHSNANKNVDGDIMWDTFVAVGTINGEPYPVTFKIRSIDSDVRSQIYEMATKNETGFSREDGTQEKPANAHSSYGTSPVSAENVAQDNENVNTQNSLSEENASNDIAPLPGNIYGKDVVLEDIAPLDKKYQTAAKQTVAEENAVKSQTVGNTMQEKLNGPLLMSDPLDQEVEKLYRMQQTTEMPDSAYFVELSKAAEAYAKAGRDFTEAFNRVVDAYQGDAKTQTTAENKNRRVSQEDYANDKSPVWRNVAYNDDTTKASIMQSTHDAMIAEGSVVEVTQDVLDTVEQSFPDLRSMKKKERAPILKEAINKLKNNIRQFLTDISNQNFEFEVNGKVLDAKLYSTGINEVLEKVTQEKANVLYSTEEIFRNARYLYSTPDYDGDPNVYRWNYFYTPVRIGDETVGVRIAVRDMVKCTDGNTPESQIYNWGIKKNASLDGGSHNPRAASSGVSSDASANNISNNGKIVNTEQQEKLHGPWRMTDELDQRVEKLYRMMLREEVSEEDYIAQLVKADRLYQQRGSKVEEALERVREAYSKETTETPETEKKMERLTRKVLHKGIMENIQEGLAKAGFDLNTILKNAKNLSTFATVDNTPQRVNEKTFGYKAGQIINDLTINKAALNESDGIQWLNGQVAKIKELSKRYGIKPGSKESRAAQIYGEGFWVNEAGEYIQYGDAELAADFPDTETQAKIKALAKSQEVRKMYDNALNAINEARVRNGYPAIPRLDNYFLHFRAQDDTFSKIGVPFNPNDIRAKDLPTDLNGVTADLKPGKPFFASEMHRTGDKTTYDLLGGLERYMNSAKNQIYHIDDIQTFRAMRNYIADMFGQANGLSDLDSLSPEEQEQRIKEVFDNHLSTYAKFLNEEANIFAGKTALIDRGVEGVLGRRAIQFLHDVNGQVGKNMVGWNVSSAGTNILPVVQATAKLPKADMVKAFAQTISNKFRSDGFVESDPALIRRKGADQFAKTPWQRLSDPGYALMSAVDNLSSELVVRAKYNELVRKGMDSQQAHIRAGEWAMRLMGDRSLGQMPQLYNSKTLGLITKFQLEVRNQLDAMGYDVVQEAKAEEGTSNGRKAAKVASTMAQLAIFQYLFGQAYESIAGYNPAFDIVENLITLFGFDDDEESEDTFRDNVEQAFLGLLEDLPYTSTLTGGRIPIASALPVKELITGKDSYGNEKNRLETIGEALPYYISPGGYGQIKKTWQGRAMFDDDLPVTGSYTDSGKLRFPVEKTFGNVLQAGLFGQYASKNARDYFDNNRSPLGEKQIAEYKELDIPISDYWAYRDGLKDKSTLAEKVEYISTLDLPVRKKNILANNLTDRKDPINLEGFEKYGNFEEFDYAVKNPGKYAVSKIATNDFQQYKNYSTQINKIEADKDAQGNTVSGSRKAKVAQYINSLPLDFAQKCVLFKSQYSSDNSYNQVIVEYIDNLKGITLEEKKAILNELGFTVHANGKITW